MVRSASIFVFAGVALAWCAGAAPLGAQCSDVWSLVATSGPAAAGGTAMAFDEARGVAVLVDLGETWTWDGASWSLASMSGPSTRWDHTLSYDPLRARVVLFGGRDASNVFGDTWEWDGASWAQVATGGPIARFGHAASFNPASSTVTLFGGATSIGVPGFEAPDLGDTWDWNGTAWTQRSASAGMGALLFASLAPRNAAGTLLLCGGLDPNGDGVGDTWRISTLSWTPANVSAIPGRREAAMSYDSSRQTVVLFGGFGNDDDYRFDTWEKYLGSIWELVSLTGPSARRSSAMAYDSLRGRMVLFGGVTASGPSGETWEYAPATPPEIPSGVAASEIRKGVALLTWDAITSTGATCTLERDAWNGSSFGAPTTAGLVGPGTTRWLDLPGAGAFRYRVKASTCAGTSTWSTDVVVLPAVPGNPTGDPMVRTSARFVWDDRSDFETRVEVQRERSSGGSTGPWSSTALAAVLPTDATTLTDRPGPGWWRYRVRAANPGGVSSWSSWYVVQVR